jgi:drug/metabolite transporter (DMT)-like permease
MLGVVAIWGSNYVIVKASLEAFEPLAFMALRFGLAALAMGALLLWREGMLARPRRAPHAGAGVGRGVDPGRRVRQPSALKPPGARRTRSTLSA